MQTIVVASNTTLFHVALRTLGDPTAWYRIAALNGLNDPLLPATTPLAIPAPLVVPSGAGA